MGGRIVFPKKFPLRQALWFGGSDAAASMHVFWLENSQGQVFAVRAWGIGRENPEELVPYLAGVEEVSSSEQLVGALKKAWLFPPHLHALPLPDFPVRPAAEYPVCEAELASAAQDFFCNLNQNIITAIGPNAVVRTYNKTAALSPTVLRNRTQAAEKFPWIRRDLGFANVKHALPTLSPEVIDSIDAGEPYERLMAAHYGVGRHALRVVAKLSQKLSEDWDALPALLVIVAAMKPDHRSRVGKSWKKMLSILSWVQRWALDADTVFLKIFATELFRDGLEGAQLIFKQSLPGHDFDDPTLNLEDYLRSHEPGNFQWDATNKFGQVFREKCRLCGSVIAVFAESVAWHKAQIELSDQLYMGLKWLPLLDDQRKDFGNFQANELTDAAALILEGVSQRICIGSYANRCVAGNCFIFSLEHSKGQRRTTAHFARGSNGLCLVEHSAYNNASPCAEAKADAAELLIYLSERLQNKRNE